MSAAKRTWTIQDEANTYSTYEVLLLRSVRTLEHLGKITAQRDALLEALRECITEPGAFSRHGRPDSLSCERRFNAINDLARAALALADGAR